MLVITIPQVDLYDERTEKFIKTDGDTVLKLENSLHAISQWERKFKKRYFPDSKSKIKKVQFTPEESLYFIKCMVLNIPLEELDDNIFLGLTEENAKAINEYIADSQSAIKSLPETKESGKKDAVPLTSERIYAWMFELQMPLEMEFWNINRLMNVIQIINYDNTPPDKRKKRPASDIARDMAMENERRLKELGTKG